MTKAVSATDNNWRFWVIVGILLFCAAGLLWRMVDLTIIDRAFLQGQSNARTVRVINIPAYRGMITDRNGQPLAISSPVDSIWINPQEFVFDDNKVHELSRLLNISVKDLRAHVERNDNREFVYLKRAVDPAVAASVKDLGIPGVYFQREYRRFYPEGEVTAHVLGFTNVDDQGQEGLELAYNDWLRGIPGRKKVIKDRLGHVVSEIETLREPRPGQNLTLSIDRRIQYLAYRELQAGAAQFQAPSGSAVVLDIKTGEILAMVNIPSYNPNNRPDNKDGRYRNRAVTDLFEPGSTIKTFSMVTALESGKYRYNSTVNTSPGWMVVDGKRIDDEGHNNGIIDLTTILKISSNMGMSKIVLSLPPTALWNMLHKLGFGQITESGFPGERPGVLVNYPVWHQFVLATLSFGYGMSATNLQLAQAYAVLGAGGVKRPTTFLRTDNPPAGEQIISETNSKQILQMLESVLKTGGTAPLAKVPGYRITGKTGTTRIVGVNGYEKRRHNGIFVGIAPASNPRLVVLVMLHDPQGRQYYGGYTAGPIFSRIMGGALRLLDIPPDNLNPSESSTLSAKLKEQPTDDR